MPEHQQVVVSNTTPLIALSLVGQLHLLMQLYGEILVPPAVFHEVMAGGRSGLGVAEFQSSSWIRVINLVDSRWADLLVDLDRGEAEAITLAHEANADLIILDERLGRRYARHLGLSMTGTLGVLIKAKQVGLLGEIAPLITELQQGGIRLGGELVRNALKLAGEAD